MNSAFTLRVPLCGLPCERLQVRPAPPGGAQVSGGCPIARAVAGLPVEESATPTEGGRPVSEDRALAAAAELLLEARSPFVFGLSFSSCGAARRAVSIARKLGGAIDVEGSEALENDLLALRTFGLASAAFGEIRRKADVVLLWRCDPRRDHPHLLPPQLPEEGPDERLFILAPPAREVASGAAHDLPVAEGGDLEALLALRAFVLGREPAGGSSGGVPHAALHRAAAALRKARYSAILWDAPATRGPAGAAVASALASLVRDLNLEGRAAARPLGAGGNVAGAMASILSDCGSPRAIGFAGGSPREAPEAYGAAPMLRGGADALLLVGAVAAAREPAADGGSAPRPRAVVIGPRLPEECAGAEVFIPTAVPAFSEKGLWLQVDGVPVPMRAPLPSARPTETEVLDRLIVRLGPGAGAPAGTRS